MTEASAVQPKVRYLFLDGLRGLAAIYVVFHHAYLEHPVPISHFIDQTIVPFFEFGRTAVDIFIVLSGFCLMLPVLKSPEGKLRSIPVFFRRRAWRILPPYYAAVVYSLVCIRFVPGLDRKSNSHWDITLPAWRSDILLSHLFLVHNLSSAWAYKINHALWSVATESQIYILFALLLLPIWRKAGIAALLLVSIGGGIACMYCFPGLNDARPWYVGLFALGMVAAIVCSSGAHQRLLKLPWGWLTGLSILLAGSTTLFRSSLKNHEWVPDLAVGLISFSLITFCAVRSRSGGQPGLILRILESKAAVWLGVTSYSLYLVHTPIIAAGNILLMHLQIPGRYHLALLGTVGTAVSVLAGWLFHIGVEQWFIPRADPRRIPSHEAPVIASLGSSAL